MQTYARLDAANRVIETWSEVEIDGQKITLDKVHTPDIAAQFVVVPDGIIAGAMQVNGVWTNPVRIAYVLDGVVVDRTTVYAVDDIPDCATPNAVAIQVANEVAFEVGYLHDDATGTFSAAPPPPPAPEPYEWLIDIGPFFDRFGLAKMAVLSSDNATVRAIVQDVSVRKWIDLQRPDVSLALVVIGSIVPAVTTAVQHSILMTPVANTEHLALRKLYFS